MAEVSDTAVKKATGKTQAEWFKLLDKAGAKQWTHKEMAQWLWDNHLPKSWWCQMLTVAYEKARGLRILGQTADAGFEIGVQKTLPISPEAAWQLVTSYAGRKIWLGDVDLKFEPGETYTTAEGTEGQIRTIAEGERIRLTWQPKDWPKPSTVQIYFLPKASGTSLHFHQEKLADSKAREQMRKHWQAIINKLIEVKV